MNDELEKLQPEVREAVAHMDAFLHNNPQWSALDAWGTVLVVLRRLAAHGALREAHEIALASMATELMQVKYELAALKARLKPRAQVVGGKVRVFMDPGDEGKYVAVLVVDK